MNRDVAYALAERPMTHEPEPLTQRELELLVRLLADRDNRSVCDLLTFSGARTAAGLMTRIVVADAAERKILITAVRRAIAGWE